jgi:preprotein translocase subunit SecB
MEAEKDSTKIQIGSIQLRDFHVIEVNFKSWNPEPENSETIVAGFNLNVRSQLVTNDKNLFQTIIYIQVPQPKSKVKLDVKLLGTFYSKDQEINDEFMNSPFVKINSPAILFPYIRAFVSSFMATAGYPSPILPAINFAHSLSNVGNKD